MSIRLILESMLYCLAGQATPHLLRKSTSSLRDEAGNVWAHQGQVPWILKVPRVSLIPGLSEKPSPWTYRDLKRSLDMMKASPGEFSVCFTELQERFFNNLPRKLKDLILLVKYWYQQVNFKVRVYCYIHFPFTEIIHIRQSTASWRIRLCAFFCPFRQHPDQDGAHFLHPSGPPTHRQSSPQTNPCPDIGHHKLVSLAFHSVSIESDYALFRSILCLRGSSMLLHVLVGVRCFVLVPCINTLNIDTFHCWRKFRWFSDWGCYELGYDGYFPTCLFVTLSTHFSWVNMQAWDCCAVRHTICMCVCVYAPCVYAL